MQYEVYLDVLFLENMMMDFLILLAVKKVFPCSATYGSLLAGSFTGSLLTCAIFFFHARYGPAISCCFSW
nr:sigma-E processing peptidase SpoIIGA [Coprococcus comes]